MIQEILRKLGIQQLNEMQTNMLSLFPERKDMVLLSPTGSGKTLAFLLPLLQVLRPGVKALQVVIIVPSRELAIQIDSVFRSMKTESICMACYGGRPAMDEHRTMMQNPPQLIVATPGRWCDHLKKENIACDAVEILILDEFDKSLELGFRDEMEFLIKAMPTVKQYVFTSATESEDIATFLETGGKDARQCTRLDYIDGKSSVVTNVTQYVVQSETVDKLDTLYKLLCALNGVPAVVFVNYRESVERTASFLKEQGVHCTAFHGAMDQEERERSLNKFRNGSVNVLVSTDLSSRGLDIPNLDTIIHYHLPMNEETYIHRCGRSGRWDAHGRSFLIINEKETCPSYIHQPTMFALTTQTDLRPTPPQWITLYIGKGKKDKVNKIDIVGFLCKKGNLKQTDIGLIEIRDRYAYVAISRNKIKQVMNGIRGEKIKGMKTLIELMKN